MLIAFLLIVVNCYQKCNLQPFDPIACIQETQYSSCFYSYFENKCIENILTNEGCQANLNIRACQNQLTDYYNQKVKCIFDTRCREVNQNHLSRLGCNQYYSKFACLNVEGFDCVWDNQCIEKKNVQFNHDTCETMYSLPVTPSLCAIIPEFPCKNNTKIGYHGGEENDYQCISMTELMIYSIDCNQPGLNEFGCLMIEKEGQLCQYINNKCQQIDPQTINGCSYKLNRIACLSITNAIITCQWKFGRCQAFTNEENNQCSTLREVNVSVCLNLNENCKYDKQKFACVVVEKHEIQQQTCNTYGLTKMACLQIKNMYCTFYNGYCEEINENHLLFYKCQMNINEDACLNIKSKSQLCKWNGNQCSNIFITQNDSCTSISQNIKVNGLVCQSIINAGEKCKYDSVAHQCIQSQQDDFCETPYINIYGCINITKIKQACQWTIDGCKAVQIFNYQTKCESLKFANYYACSQILESDSLGCYFNKISNQCEKLQIDQPTEKGLYLQQEYLKAQQFLKVIGCNDPSLGLNKIICGSILTEGQACRWLKDSCVQVKQKKYLSSITCIELQYSNSQTCAMVYFGKEPCRYNKFVKGCVNSIVKEMKCDEIGLNSYGCTLANGGCYYDYQISKCQGIQIDLKNPLQQFSDIYFRLECIRDSPTKEICLAILTKGQLCGWSLSANACLEIEVLENKKCLDFSGPSIQVNANVCASIVMRFPDYDEIAYKKDSSKLVDENRGYCAYDSNTANCIIRTTPCNSNCCTDNVDIGINQHVCSRFSNQVDNIYCYFDNFSCKELTPLTVDTSNPVAVAQFYNAQQFKCTQMNKISCYMIDWSPKQLCYYNGQVCLNVDTKDFINLDIFTVPPAIVNKYLCYSIEAQITEKNKMKYFTYNPQKKLCDIPDLSSFTKYSKCEDVDGNMNYCLRYTENLNCRWDKTNLKCITLSENEIFEIKTCSYNQNIKVCKENKAAACQFSYNLDKCINSPQNVNCDSFSQTGPVSQKACQAITQFGQMCEFQNYTCKITNKSSNQCDVQGTNSNTCYNNTKGNCRWHSDKMICYENADPIDKLKCSDNLNKVLCSKIQAEPCIWDKNLLLCIYSFGITYSTYLNLSPSDISEWACTLITGGAVYYDKVIKSCLPLNISKINYNCTDLQMNNVSCLLYTQGHNCYFDQNEIIPNNKCKPFLIDQSACTTQNQINIEVCMNIRKSCYFSASTLECLSVEIGSTVKCSQLNNDLINQKFYNKMACSSIDFSVQGTDNKQQCIKTDIQEQQMFQQECNFEKNCFWDETIYTCNILIFHKFWFDYHFFEFYWQSLNKYMGSCDGKVESQDCGSYVTKQEIQKVNYVLPGESQSLICRKKRCDLTDEECLIDSDCENVSIQNYNIEFDGTIIQRQTQAQKCVSYCQKGQDFEICDPANPQVYEVLKDQTTRTQICQYICDSPIQQNCVTKYQNSDGWNQNNIGVLVCKYNSSQLCVSKCSISNDQCQAQYQCDVLVSEPWELKLVECVVQKFYHKNPQCKGFYYILNKCKNIYSISICLTMVREPCLFNLNFGGCLPLKGNEDKIPDCYSITDNYVQINNDECNGLDNFCEFNKSQQSTTIMYNNCFSSATKNKFCTLLNEPFNAADTTCINIDRTYFHCVPLTTNYNSPYTCDSISKNDAQPALCAGANDSCRLFSGVCDSKFPNTCECDISYSKTLCEQCKCNFSFQGRCQKTYMAPQLKPDKSNYYYLCEEVNNLPTTKDNKKLACGMVEQACKYGVVCEDATNYSCDQLKISVVSKKACILCDGKSTIYDTEKYLCLQLLSKTVQECDNLNKSACLTKTTNVKCIWKDFQCQEISSLDTDQANDCSIFNLEACKISNCWYDQENQQCVIFNPQKGSCNQLLKQEHCLTTLTQSCVWNNEQCQINSVNPTQCEGLNKFGCVTQTILNCVWLNNLNKCEFFELSSQTTSCNSPISTNSSLNSLILKHSPKICTQINLQQSCYQDTQQYQCTQINILATITCDSKGLNKYACIARTQGRCKFINQQCLPTNDNNQGCQNYLNQEACLFQKETCKFQNNLCSPYFLSFSSDTDILNNLINSTDQFPYSFSVCRQFDSTTALSLVFSNEINRCINVSSRLPYINSCTLPGFNVNACLTKTTLPCVYKEDGCTNFDKILLRTATTCLESLKLNWVACSQLQAICKFKNNSCTPLLDDIDTCTQLEKQNYIVNSKVCQSRKDVACSFNSITSTCAQVKTNVLCSAIGLNKIGCINLTKGSICQFYKDECIFNYENTLCTDSINQDKCYQIKTKNQYCKFASNECISQNLNDLQRCETGIQTNAYTCSLSTDQRCFYNIKTGYCIKYVDPPNIRSQISINYDWANSISFNILTCQSYNLDNKKIKWNEGCVEVQDTELAYLKCNQYLNEQSCVQIITPFQYCQYLNGKCVEADLESFKTQQCENIKLVNNGAFCEVNQVSPCKYDRTMFSCVLVLEDTINCSEYEGYNQLACSKDTEQCSFNGSCLKNYEKNISSCDQVPENNLDICKQILVEGCTIQNNQCRKLIESEYSEYKCEQAVNSKSCLQIRTIGQTCQYFSNSCIFKDLEVIKNQNCNSITFVNSYTFCEVTQDISCKFNQKKNSCQEVSPQEEFQCIRGLNKLACLNQTSKLLRCNFLNYCYGPNNAFLNCINDPNKDCCDEAITIESCLFQTEQKCYWSNGCFQKQQIQQQCDSIKNASILVCTEIESQLCVFNPLKFACQTIIPQSCDQLQTKQQCNGIKIFPCIWNKTQEACQHKVQNNYDSCQDILDQNGNEKACIMVQSAGKLCIFHNNQCLTYYPQENQDNCLSNINKISCLQQQFSNCQWKQYQQEIKQTSSSDVENIQIGKCEKFDNFSSSSCNDTLSFLSCMNITKPGEQCRWKNNHCEVVEFEKQEIISLNSFELVSSQACSLVNDGTFVQYDSQNYGCKQIFNVEQINCESIVQGLNQQTCSNITQSLCRWNDRLKFCYPQKDSNTLVDKTCFLEGVIPKFCSQIKLQLPCAYKGNGCDQIDLSEVDCLYPGLNQYSCLNIKQYPCAWIEENEVNSCQFYYPYTQCLNIIHQITQQVCQLVEADACYYDEITSKCKTIQNNDQEINCNQSGLNAKGCVLISGCIYQNGKCQLFNTTKQYFCEEVPLANETICKNAQDACKFNIIDFSCVKSTLNDQCNTKGLSKNGCLAIDECVYNNNSCKCKAAFDLYTECTDIYQYTKCESVSFCYFEVDGKGDQAYIDILKKENAGLCKKQQCSQISHNQCNNFQIKNDICYLDSNNQCKKASNCNEIINPQNNCSLFQINQIKCWDLKSSNTCSNFTCLALSEQECLEKQNSKYCYLKNTICVELECEMIIDQIICEQYNCDWQLLKKQCHQRIPCSKYETEEECNNEISENLECTWIDSSLSVQPHCSQQSCRYLPKEIDCTGTHIGINNCVELEDNTCVACEEIKDPCQCYLFPKHCKYLKQKCKSRLCNDFQSEQECKSNDCNILVNSENQFSGCFKPCQKIYFKRDCNLETNCFWDTTSCQEYSKEVVGPEPIPGTYGNVLSIILIVFLIGN